MKFMSRVEPYELVENRVLDISNRASVWKTAVQGSLMLETEARVSEIEIRARVPEIGSRARGLKLLAEVQVSWRLKIEGLRSSGYRPGVLVVTSRAGSWVPQSKGLE